ncbi:MAG: adenylosuccinate synthase [Acidobacteria bacterium]|nr:adenylosuccinate synthase [Acidobacteriota bacterium]
MANTVVIGMQWGDEGKGKIVDLLCPAFEIVARYQGGNNAGHTVKFGDEHFALHLIPSGILHEGTECVLGNGMVVNPDAFFAEVEDLHERGITTEGRLFVSSRAHAVLPHYIELDELREASMGEHSIGTTARGIGPAYELKASRYGLRMGDLTGLDLEQHLDLQLRRLFPEITTLSSSQLPTVEQAVAYCKEWGLRLEPYLRDTGLMLDRAMQEGRGVLFEGAQGTLLDLDHGTYPYVTSSNSTAGGAAIGSGVAPSRIDGTIGVLKAYTTRVGKGPFVTELDDTQGEYLRERGHEVGTTTGRPRRCGWLDLVAARYAQRTNGVDTIALTKLDVLDGVDEIKVCVGYRVDGEHVTEMPARAADFARAKPIYRTVPGWQEPTAGLLDYDALPRTAQDYITFIELEVGAPVSIVSTGPKREETIFRNEPRFIELTDGRL